MALFAGDRVKELRQEIARLRETILATRGKKGIEVERQRMKQLARLEEIKGELLALQGRDADTSTDSIG